MVNILAHILLRIPGKYQDLNSQYSIYDCTLLFVMLNMVKNKTSN